MPRSTASDRKGLLRRALWLEVITVGWNVVEGLIAISAALAVGSVALLGFGLDSFVESASGGVLLRRLHAERSGRHATRSTTELDERARRLVAVSLFILAAYVSIDAVTTLYRRERPDRLVVGDPVAALGMTYFLVPEGREAWRGDDCCA